MCGIVGFVKKDCVSDTFEGLKLLEYRGYDSAGLAWIENGELAVCKRKGRIDRLRKATCHCADIAIGHTRWATHGAPNNINAHPHKAGRWCIVHNGIVTNYAALKQQLQAAGYRFVSATDTEVLACLLDKECAGCTAVDDVVQGLWRTMSRAEGNMAVAALSADFPDTIFLCKRGNPLIVGKGKDFFCFASDTPAIVGYTCDIYKMQDNEIAVLQRHRATYWKEGRLCGEKEYIRTCLTIEQVRKGLYATYMAKEMDEIPAVMANTWGDLCCTGVENAHLFAPTARLVATGCGTAFHACLYVAALAGRERVQCVVASEFDPDRLGIDDNTVVIAVSQSGETADTLRAVAMAKQHGARVVAITNVPQSGICMAADSVVLTHAGAEIAVAATKSYNTQLTALLYWWRAVRQQQRQREDEGTAVCNALTEWNMPHAMLRKLAAQKWDTVFLLGRGRDHATAMEGALKLKEIAYCHCETAHTGELKHGPLALVTKRTLVIVVATDKGDIDRSRTAMHEVKARGGTTMVVTPFAALAQAADKAVLLPPIAYDWLSMAAVLPLQRLAYYMATHRGIDPDKPRNLAKSVTVE